MDEGLGKETLPSQGVIMRVHPSFSTNIHPSNLLYIYLYNQLTYTHDNTPLQHVPLRTFRDFHPITNPLIVHPTTCGRSTPPEKYQLTYASA